MPLALPSASPIHAPGVILMSLIPAFAMFGVKVMLNWPFVISEVRCLDPRSCRKYLACVQLGNLRVLASPLLRARLRLPVPRTLTHYLGRELLGLLLTVQGLGAFSLITLGVMITKFGVARR